MTQSIGFVGLGIMGLPMAKNLLNAGYSVIGYNRSKPRLQEFFKAGGTPAKTIKDVEERYNTKIEMLYPDPNEVEKMVKEKGLDCFYDSIDNRKLCCAIRKVHPMNKMLATLDGWITGLRSDQNQNRSTAKMLEIDEMHENIVKVNPIINWTYDQTWEYVKSNNCPYNKLLDQGYPSIGCEPCTRPIKIGEDIRAGRWWWENDEHKECGLHMNHDK